MNFFSFIKYIILVFLKKTQKILSFLFLKKSLIIIFLLLVSVFTNFIFIFYPLQGKQWISRIYKKNLQQTLQTVEGHLIENNIIVRVLKVKQYNNIYLEFLKKQADESYLKINSVKLKGNRDGYFEYWGEPVSLMLLDDDGDGRLDIIAPTFDKYFHPHINLVVFNTKTGQFELKNIVDYPEVTIRESQP